MGKFEKAYQRFMARPAPKDIKPDEVIYLAEKLGFNVEPGGKHPIKITNPTTGAGYPVAVKKGVVSWVYVERLQKWFKEKEEESQS